MRRVEGQHLGNNVEKVDHDAAASILPTSAQVVEGNGAAGGEKYNILNGDRRNSTHANIKIS